MYICMERKAIVHTGVDLKNNTINQQNQNILGQKNSSSTSLKNDIRDVGSTADFVLVFLVHLVHWYPLVPTGTWWYLMVPDGTWRYLSAPNSSYELIFFENTSEIRAL